MTDAIAAAFGAAITPSDDPKPARKRRAAPAVALTEQVTALAQSLGVQAVNVDGVATYKPDGFVLAIKRVHDALLGVKDDLMARHADVEAREAALDAREAAIQAREERQAGFDALGELIAFQPVLSQRRGFLGLFGGRS